MASKRIEISCRCGTRLSADVDDTDYHNDLSKRIILFCEDCYLNHEVQLKNDTPVVTMQYYFPDD